MNIRNLWFYFRLGHAGYLGFALSMINTILIVYHFGFNGIISDMYLFALILVAVYAPLAIIAGKFHTKFQFNTEIEHANAHNKDLQDIKKLLQEINNRIKQVENERFI